MKYKNDILVMTLYDPLRWWGGGEECCLLFYWPWKICRMFALHAVGCVGQKSTALCLRSRSRTARMKIHRPGIWNPSMWSQQMRVVQPKKLAVHR